MTGEELYARWCVAVANDRPTDEVEPLPAWPFLERKAQLAWERVAQGLPALPPALRLINQSRPKLPEHHTLYRCYDAASVLLYIGSSSNPTRRFEAHARDKAWWPEVAVIEHEQYETRDELLRAESQAIRNDAPLHNKRGAA